MSDDHHQALVLARRALDAGIGRDAPSSSETWAEVVRRFELELAPHFAIEERWLVPALAAVGAGALAERTRDEHAELRRLVSEPGGAIETRLSAFGAALRNHVRFEERILFPLIQEKVSPEVLERVAAKCREIRAARCANRS